MTSISRRSIIGGAAAWVSHRTWLATLAGAGALAHHAAGAASNDYRALVCLYLAGGNDSHNWVVPGDPAEYANYAAARSNLAVPLAQLRPLPQAGSQAAGRQFSMPADLDPVRELYQQGRLAVVANVGTIERPTSLADFHRGRGLPAKLFSHNDQTANWHSFGSEGSSSGWGGRMAEALADINANPLLSCVSVSRESLFLRGRTLAPFRISRQGLTGIRALDQNRSRTLGSTTTNESLRNVLLAAQTASPLQAAYAATAQRAQKMHELVNTAAQGHVYPALPTRSLRMSNGGSVDLAQLNVAHELRAVAQQISLARNLGMRRQVFMVVMDGFDTHGAQLTDQPRLMAGASLAIRYFIDEMERIGMGQAVTLFTASEFGRTLSSNGAGSDHGWGSHHFVAGGAVRGGDIYGRFPDVVMNGPQDIGSGRLLPSMSVTEYGATLARWLGVPGSDIQGVFPFLPEFNNPFGNWL